MFRDADTPLRSSREGETSSRTSLIGCRLPFLKAGIRMAGCVALVGPKTSRMVVSSLN